MSTILLSFEAKTFERLEHGGKKFEYRKHFPKGETKVYFYVSNPIKAITGIGYFGEREELVTWLDKYANRPIEVRERIQNYISECNYVAPMYWFQKTIRIPLDKLRHDIPEFVVPRMYYYLDDTKLLTYLEKELKFDGEIMTHHFEIINDNDIC